MDGSWPPASARVGDSEHWLYRCPCGGCGKYVEGGSLYHGPCCMCLQRWSFLQGRFQELRKEESGMSEEIRMAVVEAVQTMRTAESRMGYTLSE